MNLEALKEKARRHEQKEEWRKALDAYLEVIRRQDQDEPPDITLYNRCGDIQIRLKEVTAAVRSYEKAIDLYTEAELPNNAIAVCKKVLRNLPDRSGFFLRLGRIRGAQGFLTDAKENFLTYAERMTAVGDMDGAMNALAELVELAPDDVEIRLGLAAQLESHDRVPDAVEHYTEAYRHLVLQDRDSELAPVSAKLEELAPGIALPDFDAIRAGVAPKVEGPDFLTQMGLGGFELGSGVQDEDAGRVEAVGPSPALTPEREAGLEEKAEADAAGEEAAEYEPLPTLNFDEEEAEALPPLGPDEDEKEGAEPLPILSSSEEERGDEGEGLSVLDMDYEEAGELLRTLGMSEEEMAEAVSAYGEEEQDSAPVPTLDFSEDEPGEGEVEPLPTLDFPGGEGVPLSRGTDAGGEEDVGAGAVEEAFEDARFDAGPSGEAVPASHRDASERGDLDLALELVRIEIGERPDEVDLYQRQVEYAFRKGETGILVPAYLDLAACLVRTGAQAKARAVFQQALSLSPGNAEALAGLRELEGVSPGAEPAQVASSEEYVDLGSLILGDEAEKTTRWRVTADSPTGDDQADFARMLSQFKEKVSENVDADDLSAHHDLGTAYLEMGLLDEAIGEFQMALKADPNHLPTHEVMGRCWIEKGEPGMAVRALNRALDADFDVEDELIGIYYLMGKAKEELGDTEEAVEFYEKVFSLDINFKDVTERLRTLR